MKISIDLEKCHKAGECYYNHPDLFEMQDDGFPRIKVVEISTDGEKLEAEQAIEVCPAGAISID